MEIATISTAIVQTVLQGLQSVVGVARARNRLRLHYMQVKDFEEKLERLKRVIAEVENVEPPRFTSLKAKAEFDKLIVGVATASADAYIQKALVALKHAQEQQENSNSLIAALKETVNPSALASLLDYWNNQLDTLAVNAGEAAGVSFSEGVSGIIRARNMMKVQDLQVNYFHDKLMKLKEIISEREQFQPMRFVSLEAEIAFCDLQKGLEAANSDIDIQKAFACPQLNSDWLRASAFESLLDHWNIRLDALAIDAKAKGSYRRQKTISSYCKRSKFYLRHDGHYERLQAFLRDDSKKVVVISGMVGTGKSCLALDAGISQDEEGEHFSGGVYLLDFSNLPTTEHLSNQDNPEVLMKQRELLRHLGFPFDLISSVHAGTEAIEHAFSNDCNRPRLVILDNIQDGSVLKKFVFPQFDNIKVLLTTQNNELISATTSLGDISSEIIQLLPQRSEFDEKLLLKYIPKLQVIRDELQDSASQILQSCDGCFQAIAILGSALNKVEDTAAGWMQVLNDFCYYLKRNYPGDKGNMFAAIDTTKARLEDSSVTCLTAMGLFAPSTKIPTHLVHLACQSQAVQGYQVAIDELVEANLLIKYVEPDPITGLQMVFYQVHTIVGEYIKTASTSDYTSRFQEVAGSPKQEIVAALTDLITVTGELKPLVRDCRYSVEEIQGWMRRHNEDLNEWRYSNGKSSSLDLKSTDVTEVREYLTYFIDSLLGYLNHLRNNVLKSAHRPFEMNRNMIPMSMCASSLSVWCSKASSVLKINNNYRIGKRLQMLKTLKELPSANSDSATRLSVLLMTFGRSDIAGDAVRLLGYADSWVPEVRLEWQWEDQLATVQKLVAKTLSTWAWAKGINGQHVQAKKHFMEALINDPYDSYLAMVHEATIGAAVHNMAAQDLHRKILESQQAVVERESIQPLRFISTSAERAFHDFKEGLKHATDELNRAVVDEPEILAALQREASSTQENNPIWLKASLLKGLEAVQVDIALESKVSHWRQQLIALQSKAEIEGSFRKKQSVSMSTCYLRHDEHFNRLKTLLLDKVHRVVIVSGMFGAGKSCLALDATLELDDGVHFPGGVQILDFSNRMMDSNFHSILSFKLDRACLLVLDNVISMDVVTTFISAAEYENVKVLLTTRSSSGVPYASVEIIPRRSGLDDKLLLKYVTRLHSIPSNLTDVAEALLARCDGCFQAIALLGLALNRIRPEILEWERVLENFIECLEANGTETISESLKLATGTLSSHGLACLRDMALFCTVIPEQVVDLTCLRITGNLHPDAGLKELLAANLLIKRVHKDPATGKTMVGYQVHTIISDYILEDVVTRCIEDVGGSDLRKLEVEAPVRLVTKSIKALRNLHAFVMKEKFEDNPDLDEKIASCPKELIRSINKGRPHKYGDVLDRLSFVAPEQHKYGDVLDRLSSVASEQHTSKYSLLMRYSVTTAIKDLALLNSLLLKTWDGSGSLLQRTLDEATVEGISQNLYWLSSATIEGEHKRQAQVLQNLGHCLRSNVFQRCDPMSSSGSSSTHIYSLLP